MFQGTDILESVDVFMVDHRFQEVKPSEARGRTCFGFRPSARKMAAGTLPPGIDGSCSISSLQSEVSSLRGRP
jgi:hypothetical protein